VVIGLPKNMNGTEGESANFSRRLADLIKRNLNLKVEFVDERLTTEEAIRQIHQAEKKVGKSKETIDMLSAAIILQSYLDKN
jgi:putative Holliday junction resolvase